jgi:hypothetical protein
MQAQSTDKARTHDAQVALSLRQGFTVHLEGRRTAALRAEVKRFNRQKLKTSLKHDFAAKSQQLIR